MRFDYRVVGRVSREDIAALGLRASEALAHGNERTILPIIAKAAASERTNPTLWHWTGLLQRALDDHVAAMEALAAAAELAPNDARIAHAYARTALEAGIPAVALFERAHIRAPMDGDILLGLTAARFAQGDVDGAITGIDSLLMGNPGWIAGHETLGRLRWEHGERIGFARSFERALATAPRDSSLWRSYIILLIHAEQWDQALDAIGRALSMLGEVPFLAANEAIVRSQRAEIERADQLFEALEGVGDETVAAHHLRHELRNCRLDRAAKLTERWATIPDAQLVWPYIGLVWRLRDDPRWHWLEGDERLVSQTDVDLNQQQVQALAAALRGLHLARSDRLDQSVRGGTQTDGPLFSRIDPEIRQLRTIIADAVAQHVAQLPPIDEAHPILRLPQDRETRFAGSWSVRLRGRGHHAHHIHPAGWFSSAFYVQLPDMEQEHSKTAGWLSLGVPQQELGLALTATRLIEPKVGRLVLFPSTMWHGTIPFDQGERLTVAFDVARPTV